VAKQGIHIFFFLLMVGLSQAWAQSPVTDSSKKKLTPPQERAKLSADSLRLMQKADSLQKRFDRLQSKLGFSTDSIRLLKEADSLGNKFNSFQNKINTSASSSNGKINSPMDSVNQKLESTKKKWQSKLDSLKQGGAATEVKKYEQKLDSLEKFPQQQYDKLMAAQEKLKSKAFKNPQKLQDSLQSIKGEANEKLAEINKVADKVGIGALGKDIKTGIPDGINTNQLTENLGLKNGLPQLPGANNPLGGSTAMPNVSGIGNPVGTSQKIPSLPAGQTGLGGLPSLPNEAKDITNGINEATKVTKEIGEVSKQANQYTKEAKAVKEEGLENAKKIPELIEKQADNITEIKSLEREKAAMEKEMKMQKELIEKYKNEQAIKEDMEKKVKEMANDKITEFQAKVDAPMKDLKKYQRKFSDVQDMRNLPKRASNPMKGLSWRERVVPGFSLQTILKTKTWLEINPQVYYKLNGSWSAGAGWVYRFSMDAGKLAFDDFGNLNGQIIFLQYHSFKGFFLRAEAEHVRWKPWAPQPDKDFKMDLYAAAIGIGKSFSFSEKLKGNVQTLYHYTWQSPDPYQSAIEIRFGLDFSLKPKKREAWKTKLRELERQVK
jgi:uncharacterized coiled-coil DUF342 family protein